jgi:hypothetical protein
MRYSADHDRPLAPLNRLTDNGLNLMTRGPLQDKCAIRRAPGPKPERRLSQSFRGCGNSTLMNLSGTFHFR